MAKRTDLPTRARPIGTLGNPLSQGVAEIVNMTLGLQDYRTRSSCLEAASRPGCQLMGRDFVDALYQSVSARWRGFVDRLTRLPPSEQNWRWFDPRPEIPSEKNRRPETTLERAFIRACLALGRKDWSNQVPIASGIAGPSAHKTSAVDLVHQRSTESFELIELKVGSDTPLYAAIEIVVYGLIWILSRQDRERLRYPTTPILSASEITLAVLAPAKPFYQVPTLDWLSEPLTQGISDLARRELAVRMSFEFQQFSPPFAWPAEYTAQELYAHLCSRSRR